MFRRYLACSVIPAHSQDNTTLLSTAPSPAGKSSSTTRHLPCRVVGWDCSSHLPPQSPKTKLSPTASELPQRKKEEEGSQKASCLSCHTCIPKCSCLLSQEQAGTPQHTPMLPGERHTHETQEPTHVSGSPQHMQPSHAVAQKGCAPPSWTSSVQFLSKLLSLT